MKCALYTMMGGVAAVWAAGLAAEVSPRHEEDLSAWFERSNGVYSIFEAALAKDAATLEARLREGDAPNARNELGDTPLHIAAAAGAGDIATLLLEAGADPLASDAAGRIPSAVAANDACREICRRFEARRHAELALFPLVQSGKYAELQAALSAGANPNALSQDNSLSLLAAAVQSGSVEATRLLLAAKANPNFTRADSKSLLHIAAAAGRAELIPLLLEAGADPLASGGNGAMAIHDAIWAGQTAAALALIPAYKAVGFNPDGKGNGYPIVMAIRNGNSAVVRALLQAGLDPNSPAFAAEPLTVLAARLKRPEILQLLLQAGADKTARDASGKTADDYLPLSPTGR